MKAALAAGSLPLHRLTHLLCARSAALGLCKSESFNKSTGVLTPKWSIERDSLFPSTVEALPQAGFWLDNLSLTVLCNKSFVAQEWKHLFEPVRAPEDLRRSYHKSGSLKLSVNSDDNLLKELNFVNLFNENVDLYCSIETSNLHSSLDWCS